MTQRATAAVDEGRDPYGLPGVRGNFGDAWRLLNELPCSDCGATHKSLVVDKNRATVLCGEATMPDNLEPLCPRCARVMTPDHHHWDARATMDSTP